MSDSSSIRRPFVGGNWKMNTTLAAAVELAEGVVASCQAAAENLDVVVFPPFPYLQAVGRAIGHHEIRIGAQNFWPKPNGAHTGEVGLEMLEDLAIGWLLIGHSERRQHCGEDDELVAKKVAAASDAGFAMVLCVGETLDQREAGDATSVVCGQVEAGLEGISAATAATLGQRLVIAYEPVWAIGTGRTATPQDAQDGHAAIRRTLATRYHDAFARTVRIIYGGSMNVANAAGLLAKPDVDGGLIGGASLTADAFASICAACAARSTAAALGSE